MIFIKNAKNHFSLLKTFKNTESAQLWRPRPRHGRRSLGPPLPSCSSGRQAAGPVRRLQAGRRPPRAGGRQAQQAEEAQDQVHAGPAQRARAVLLQDPLPGHFHEGGAGHEDRPDRVKGPGL